MIGVHVIGPGYGESIVIELPTGEVGVIDSYGSCRTGPPTLNFLAEQYPAMAKLKFVAVTHPHADHCMGMYRYFERYAVEEFWFFHSFIKHACMGFFKAMHDMGTRDAIEMALGMPSGSVWLEALRLWKAVKGQEETLTKRHLIAGLHAELCEGSVRFHFLTPNDEGMWRYSSALAAAEDRLIADGPRVNPDWDPANLPHNQACGAMLLEYGRTRILLMADAEDDLWREMVREKGDNPLPKVHFIKGSHHGSANGFNSKIYNCVASEDSVVVITPFNRHRSPLPTAEGVERMRPHAKEILCTNSVEACKSSGLAWRASAHKSSIPLPREWAADCRADPRLLALLDDQQAMHPYLEGRVKIPRRWLHECQRRPELLQLLCIQLRNRKVIGGRERINNEFRVSVKYDDTGNIMDKYVGWGVGRLSDEK